MFLYSKFKGTLGQHSEKMLFVGCGRLYVQCSDWRTNLCVGHLKTRSFYQLWEVCVYYEPPWPPGYWVFEAESLPARIPALCLERKQLQYLSSVFTNGV